MCGILSAKWLCESIHVNGMQKAIESRGGGQFDIDKIATLAMAAGHSAEGSFESESEAWLKQREFPLHELVFSDTEGAIDARASKRNIPNDILMNVHQRRFSSTVLPPMMVLLKIAGTQRFQGNQVHATAMLVYPIGRTRYFDPNFGEFTFNDWSSFANWLPYYYDVSSYAKTYNKYVHLRYFRSDFHPQAPQIPMLQF
jgi:hypothetical protein